MITYKIVLSLLTVLIAAAILCYLHDGFDTLKIIILTAWIVATAFAWGFFNIWFFGIYLKWIQ